MEVDQLEMYPMDFEEFAEANDSGFYLKMIAGKKEDIVPSVASKPLEKLLKEYFVVGRMPEVVQDRTENRDIEKVDELQNTILEYYRNDFANTFLLIP